MTIELTEPVIGFRAWRIQDDRLVSAVRAFPWPVTDVYAECSRGSSVPDCRRAGSLSRRRSARACPCGIYARHTIDVPECTDDGVLGAIVGWGQLAVAQDGFRCERARIVALADTGVPGLERVASLYGVPLLPVDALEPYAREFGKPLGPDLRPFAAGAALSDLLRWSRDGGAADGTSLRVGQLLARTTPSAGAPEEGWWRHALRALATAHASSDDADPRAGALDRWSRTGIVADARASLLGDTGDGPGVTAAELLVDTRDVRDSQASTAPLASAAVRLAVRRVADGLWRERVGGEVVQEDRLDTQPPRRLPAKPWGLHELAADPRLVGWLLASAATRGWATDQQRALARLHLEATPPNDGIMNAVQKRAHGLACVVAVDDLSDAAVVRRLDRQPAIYQTAALLWTDPDRVSRLAAFAMAREPRAWLEPVARVSTTAAAVVWEALDDGRLELEDVACSGSAMTACCGTELARRAVVRIEQAASLSERVILCNLLDDEHAETALRAELARRPDVRAKRRIVHAWLDVQQAAWELHHARRVSLPDDTIRALLGEDSNLLASLHLYFDFPTAGEVRSAWERPDLGREFAALIPTRHDEVGRELIDEAPVETWARSDDAACQARAASALAHRVARGDGDDAVAVAIAGDPRVAPWVRIVAAACHRHAEPVVPRDPLDPTRSAVMLLQECAFRTDRAAWLPGALTGDWRDHGLTRPKARVGSSTGSAR